METLLGELELSGDEEGRVDGSEPAVDVDSMTTGNKVVRRLERSGARLVYSRCKWRRRRGRRGA